MSRFLAEENVIPIYEDTILTTAHVIPIYEDDILTTEIHIPTNREVIKSESVTSNRHWIKVTPQLHHWIYWGLSNWVRYLCTFDDEADYTTS